jgi:beta-glucanase (GH16 family)
VGHRRRQPPRALHASLTAAAAAAAEGDSAQVVAPASLLVADRSSQHGRVHWDDSWTLLWQDDFEGSALNASNWTPWDNVTHCAPCEAELYLAANVGVRNGTLVLTTQRAHVLGPDGQYYNFTSGWVDSENKFSHQYGRFAVSAKLPAQNASGAWPAHWLMPQADVCWPVGGEIDIMEGCSNPFLFDIAGSYRWGTSCDNDNQELPGGLYGPVDWAAGFHTFMVEWNATALAFSVDDNVYEVKTAAEVNLPTTPMYWILNTAIAWFFPPGPTAAYPATHVIDWVRVYVNNATTGT